MSAVAPVPSAVRGPSSGPGPARAPAFTRFDLWLYVVTVFGWSTSWIAMKMQVGVVAPEVSIAWRFLFAGALTIGWAFVSGRRLRFPLTDHLRFLALGGMMFSVNFHLFYSVSAYLPSGLLSVVFSLTSVFNLLLGAALLGQRIEPRLVLGGLAGFAGIGLIYWPVIAATGFDRGATVGLGMCIAATVLFCGGNILSGANQRRGLPVVPASAYGMLYGAAIMAAVALVNGRDFAIEWTPAYLGGMAWLVVVASVIAFASYLTLLGRIGAARAGYATVVFPVFALAISTVFEGYQWTAIAVVGLVAVMAGNLIVLTRGR